MSNGYGGPYQSELHEKIAHLEAALTTARERERGLREALEEALPIIAGLRPMLQSEKDREAERLRRVLSETPPAVEGGAPE
jgi:hypothetical protein